MIMKIGGSVVGRRGAAIKKARSGGRDPRVRSGPRASAGRSSRTARPAKILRK